MKRTCSTCTRFESHRWCCIRERLKLAQNELTGVLYRKIEEVEAEFLNEFKVEIKFGVDFRLDYQVADCARWAGRYKDKKDAAEVG